MTTPSRGAAGCKTLALNHPPPVCLSALPVRPPVAKCPPRFCSLWPARQWCRPPPASSPRPRTPHLNFPAHFRLSHHCRQGQKMLKPQGSARCALLLIFVYFVLFLACRAAALRVPLMDGALLRVLLVLPSAHARVARPLGTPRMTGRKGKAARENRWFDARIGLAGTAHNGRQGS